MNASLGPLYRSAESGDPAARDALFASLYRELHDLAQRELHRNRGLTLGATTLVHEAYLKLARRDGLAFPDRARFMAYAARAMRGIVVDHARRRQALRRGGSFSFVSLAPDLAAADAVDVDAQALGRLSDAVERLAALAPGLAEVVDLKYFCGFSFVEIAAMRGVSERTVLRDWQKAKILLHRELGD